MPAGGGDGLIQAISYQMKHFHPGTSARKALCGVLAAALLWLGLPVSAFSSPS